jgi:SAM-dependent methyltransferase
LPPVVVIAGVVIGTATAGLLGAVLAAPVIATGRVVAAYALNKIFDRDPFFRLMPAPAEVIGWRDLLLRARHFILRLRFAYRYWRGVTPWDTNVTPPELLAFLDQAAPGRALDLGCGTGTNVITLAQHGWEATGVDFVRRAIRQAKRKAAQAGVTVQLLQADVTDLSMLTGPYDLALDIGCMASVPAWGREAYSAGLARLVRPGGRFLLYSWLPRSRHGQIIGLSPDEVSAYLAPGFTVDRVEFGQDQGAGSAWYRLTRK